MQVRSKVRQFITWGTQFALIAVLSAAASAGGTTRVEKLSGPPINGIVPEGQATADMSQFVSGGSTFITYQVKKVNLPDGTVLNVTLDFGPQGTITLSKGEGKLTVDEGHFGVSHDNVRVYNGSQQILIGGSFL